MEKIYNSREEYYKKLLKLQNNSLIKVLTGIPKSGKSFILKNFKKYLIKNNINKDDILYIDFSDLNNSKLNDYKKIYAHISSFSRGKENAYILLDNLELISSFQKVLESLIIKDNIDLYIAIKQIKNLSNELLKNANISIFVFPLSFKEYALEINQDKETCFKSYLEKGGFPVLLNINDKTFINQYLTNLYNSIILNDILSLKKINDVTLLNNLTKFLIDNLTNLLSFKKISDCLNNMSIKTNHLTIKTYMEFLLDTNLIYKVDRYDIKNGIILKSLNKFYFCDIGFINNLFAKKKKNILGVLENIVFLNLLKSDYKIYIGKLNDLEVSFIAFKDDKKFYFQVATSILGKNDFNYYINPLLKINDNFPKYIISLDKIDCSSDGIINLNIIDFLLNF